MDSDPRLLWANWPRRRQLPAIRNMMGYLLVLAAGLCVVILDIVRARLRKPRQRPTPSTAAKQAA